MRLCFALCMVVCLVSFMDSVSAYRHLLEVGVYDTGSLLGGGVYITATTAATAGTGKLGGGSFVPVLKR